MHHYIVPVHFFFSLALLTVAVLFNVLVHTPLYSDFSLSCSAAVLGRGPDEEEEEQVEDGPGG